MVRRTALTACLLTAAAATPAAADWSRPASLPGGDRFDDAAPRTAIADDGSHVTAWTRGASVVLATGTARGRVTGPRRVGRWRSVALGAAAGPGGAALVTWEAADGIRIALRTRRGGAFRIRRVADSSGEAISGLQAVHDPLGGWVIAESQFADRTRRIRTLTLTADGRPVAAPQTLGEGFFGIDARPSGALAVDARGLATVVWEAPDGPVAFAERPHGGVFGPGIPVPFERRLTDPRVTPGPNGSFITATRPASCGDVGCSGVPVLFQPRGGLVGLTLPRDNRAFGPGVAATGAGAALVFSYKDRPAAFSPVAPVRAVAFGPAGAGTVQRLTGARVASEPVALPLSRGRALAMWAGTRGWGAAVAGPDGRFRTTDEPAGPPPSRFHTNATNRDIRTAGRWAIAAWGADRRVRISVRGF